LDESITDECYLVERLGHSIAIVEGSPRNIKVTHPEDLLLAEALMRENE
jgi:2-C-methyl-D-erythritol 4-phosphate cytidylyltransferase